MRAVDLIWPMMHVRKPSIRAICQAALCTLLGTSVALAATPSAGTSPARIDLQVSLCAPPDQVERAFDLQARGPAFDVWLFDDNALSLYGRGVRLRLRMKSGGAEFTLKVANQDCAQLAPGLVPRHEGKCEYDSHGLDVAGAVSLSRTIDAHFAQDLISGRQSVQAALSQAQARFLRQIVGLWPLPHDVRPLGPQQVHSWQAAHEPYLIDVTALPSGEEFIELSRKVPLANAAEARKALERDLARTGVASCPDQSAQALNKLRALTGASRK